jgi:hypothetical protein
MVIINAAKQELGRWRQVFGKQRKLRGEIWEKIFYRESILPLVMNYFENS